MAFCLQQQQYQSLGDVSGCGASTTTGVLLAPADYNDDDSRSNTDTASETSASAYDCSDGSTTCDRRRRCSRFSRSPTASYHGGRRREQPPAVFRSLTERRVWERERLKKDNHNTSMIIPNYTDRSVSSYTYRNNLAKCPTRHYRTHPWSNLGLGVSRHQDQANSAFRPLNSLPGLINV